MKKILLEWFFVYLFIAKLFTWYDKFLEYDGWWETIVQHLIFRDGFIIVFVLGIYYFGGIIDTWKTPRSLHVRWAMYYVILYAVFTMVYVVYNQILQRFFQATPEAWQTWLPRWTVLYAIVMIALYVKYFIFKKDSGGKTIATKANKLQKIRLKSGEEAVVVEILNDGKDYRVEMLQGDRHHEQRTIPRADIKSVFESIETPLGMY